MNMVVGVMEAPGKLPLIEEFPKGVGELDGLQRRPCAEPIKPAEPPLWASSWVNGWTPVGE